MTIEKKPKAKAEKTKANAPAPLFVGQSTTGPGVAPVAEIGRRDWRDDFVVGVLDLVCAIKPMDTKERKAAEAALRSHYGAEKHYVAARGPDEDAGALARKVLALMNGSNPRTVARTLGIGRATVYRILKQAGGK